MYYYEKDYIMRLIHGIARMLAYLFFGRLETDLPRGVRNLEGLPRGALSDGPVFRQPPLPGPFR